jgi:MYND finger/Sel1 repeat
MIDPLSESPYRDPDYQTSRGWPLTALQQAESGDIHAQLYMAFFAYNNGPPAMRSSTVRWYEMAANQGSVYAMINLSHLYEFGESGMSIDQDLPRACYWMKMAISKYDDAKNSTQRDAIRDVMLCYGWYLLGAKTPDGAVVKCSLPENLQDTVEGLRWLEKAGDLGHKDAVDQLGNLYMTGQHPKVGRHADKGMEWFKKGAKMGNGKNAFQLAMAYKSGLVPVNPKLEQQWLKVAAQLGNDEARGMLADSRPVPPVFDRKKDARRRLRHINKEKNIEEYLGTDESDKCFNPSCGRKDNADTRFQSCSKCKSVKYCSRECQVEHWKNGHKSQCKTLEKSKEEMKGMNRNNLALLVDQCFVCEKKGDDATVLMRCAKCKVPKYCSSECQVKHWKNGHKAECAKTAAEFKEAQDIIDKKN